MSAESEEEDFDLDEAIRRSIMDMSLLNSSASNNNSSASSNIRSGVTRVSSGITRVYSSVDIRRPGAKLGNNTSNQVEEQRQNFLLQISNLLDEIERIKAHTFTTPKFIENKVKEKHSQIEKLQARLTALDRQHSNSNSNSKSNSNSNSNSNTNIRNNDSERRKILDRISSLDVRAIKESNELVIQEILEEIEVLRLKLDTL